MSDRLPRGVLRRTTAGRRLRRTGADGSEPDSGALPGELVLFVAAALIALLVVGATSAVISHWLARDSVRDEARQITERLARFVVTPLLPDAGSPGGRAPLDAVLESRMKDGSVLFGQVLDGDGRVVYSTDRELEGTRGVVTDELRRALDGEVVTAVESESETPLPDHVGPVVEIYAPFTSEGRDLVFELYFDGAAIQRDETRLRNRLLPLTMGGLILLELVQIPLAVSLGRRLSRQERERRRLVQDHLAASEHERRTIASDLHDGPVQDLAGVSYSLSALRTRLPEDQAARVDRMITAVRKAVASLRRVMVDIYPPDLSPAGLALALDGLAKPLREEGLIVEVSAGPLPDMPTDSVAVLYRSAKEALVNVVRHADARTVWIGLQECSTDDGSTVRLTVADDGKGVPVEQDADPTHLPSSGDGHLGLRLARDRVLAAGGRFRLARRTEGGTLLTVDIPVTPRTTLQIEGGRLPSARLP